MVDDLRTKATNNARSTENSAPDDCAAASAERSGMSGCGMGKKGLKGMLMMAACCGAPLLLLLALPLLGSALGSLGASAVSTLALLACPVGMVLMMWMMMRGQRAEATQQAQAQAVLMPQVGNTASSIPRDAAVLQDIADVGEDAVTSSSVAQEDKDTPSQRVNGRKAAISAPAAGSSESAVLPQD